MLSSTKHRTSEDHRGGSSLEPAAVRGLAQGPYGDTTVPATDIKHYAVTLPSPTLKRQYHLRDEQHLPAGEISGLGDVGTRRCPRSVWDLSQKKTKTTAKKKKGGGIMRAY